MQLPPNNRLQGCEAAHAFAGREGLRAGPALCPCIVISSIRPCGAPIRAGRLRPARCDGRQPEFSDEEASAIYIAALNGDVRQDPPREAALNRHLMSDNGNYSPSGLMPERVVERLRAQGPFSEVCGDGPSDEAGPRCISQRARSELRLSRPIPRDSNAVDVYIGGGSIRPVNDTTTVFFPVGDTIRCRIVRESGRWVRKACEQTMVV